VNDSAVSAGAAARAAVSGPSRQRCPGLYVESFGAGPDVVLVHGWSMHAGIWRDFAEFLAKRVRVTLVDLPGHGGSGSLPDFTLDTVTAALAEIAPPRAVWLGWSLGVLFALKMAEIHPERVEGLVLLAGNPRFIAEEDWPGVEASLLEQVAANLDRDFFGTLRRFIGLQTYGQDNARALARLIESRLEECPAPEAAALHGGLAVLRKSDLREALREAGKPALAIFGGHDRMVPKAVAEAIRDLSPGMETHVLATAAHLPFATHPEQTAGLVLDFIERLPPRS
jgi:pimeloyl-[acyl-carrier protein] methyl ester esterase